MKMEKQKEWIIFQSNIDFEEWKEGIIKDYADDEDMGIEDWNEDDWWDRFNDDINIWFQDEQANLRKKVDGVIVCFANLGLWYGNRVGVKTLDSNINSILDYFSCDDIKIYCDRYQCRAEGYHHDGCNSYEFGIAKDAETAEKLEEMAYFGTLTYEKFKRYTKSLRPHIAKIFGWK